jgi:hypothetical protein
MNKVYIVQVQGWGDDEDAFYNTGAYSTKEKADAALAELVAQAQEDELEVVTNVEVITVDA